MLYCDSNHDCYSVTLLITLLRKRAKIYIFHCYKSLGVRDKHRLKTKKKLLGRKTEEAVSLVQKSGCSDLIPSWCKAPEDISPPETLPSTSEAPPLMPLRPFQQNQVLPRGEKRIKQRRKQTHNSPWGPDMLTRVWGLLPQKQGW